MPLNATCRLCGSEYRTRGLSRHLQACLPKHLDRLEDASEGARKALHIAVHGYGILSNQYRLDLVVDPTTTLNELDDVLRDVWMECCGHRSAFSSGDTHDPVGDVASVRDQLRYEYDFGTTSEAELNVRDAIALDGPAAPVQLVARNDPLEPTCHRCGDAPATQICTACTYHAEAFLYCDDCTEAHGATCESGPCFVELVNSPRTGMCGYEGPSVEPERLSLDDVAT